MSEAPEERPAVGKRAAWTYAPQAAPPFADFRAGGDRRKRFLKYWLHDNIGNGWDIAMYFGMKLLSARACSDFGAFLGRHLVPRSHKAALARTRTNIARLRSEMTPAQLDGSLLAYAESQGRQMTEYSVVTRIARNSRLVRFVGTENLVETCREQPVIFMGAHTSNWEVLMTCLAGMGMDVMLNYDPPRLRSRHWIVNRVRRAGGIILGTPGKEFVRPALRRLTEGGNLLIFCDEGFNGRIRAPFFGFPPHMEGNYAVVARMARRTGALIWPIYMTRDEGVNFTFHALAPIKLSSEGSLVDDVMALNAVMEPVIRENAEQWYFVDNRMPEG